MKLKYIAAAAVLAILAGCSNSPPAPEYPKDLSGENITRIVVEKGDRRLKIYNGEKIIRDYHADLGFAPVGDKKHQGDGKTPEGEYRIDRKNPQSRFHLSVGINYPNKEDRAEALALGKDPGGDIFIHGQGRAGKNRSGTDWTWGCVAITDSEMEEIFEKIKVGTPVSLLP